MIDLRDQSGFTVEEQEVSNFRTAVLTESRVIDLGTKYWNPAYFVAVDELQAALPRSVEEKDASWDRSGGNAREPARIKIRAPEGSEVFYSTGQMPAIRLVRCKRGKVKVSTQYAAYGIKLTDCEDVDIKIDSLYCAHGIEVMNSKGIRIHDSRIDYAGHAGVKVVGDCDVSIENTMIYRPCFSESTGGVYGAGGSGVTVLDCTIVEPAFGVYWKWDGSGIYPDHHSGNWRVMRNTISGAHIALQDNSGSPGNVMTHNTLVNCDHAIDWTDAYRSQGMRLASTRGFRFPTERWRSGHWAPRGE